VFVVDKASGFLDPQFRYHHTGAFVGEACVVALTDDGIVGAFGLESCPGRREQNGRECCVDLGLTPKDVAMDLRPSTVYGVNDDARWTVRITPTRKAPVCAPYSISYRF
jgi:hypothetical protein